MRLINAFTENRNAAKLIYMQPIEYCYSTVSKISVKNIRQKEIKAKKNSLKVSIIRENIVFRGSDE